MFTADQLRFARHVLERCRIAGLALATAESCTGGLIAACLTAIPGSSDVFVGGVVAYSNAMKARLLGVPETVLDQHGAVDEGVARAMAEGLLRLTGAGLGVGVTGIAGPGGGSALKPVGLVHFAAARREGPTVHERQVFEGDRHQIRMRTVEAALMLLSRQLD